MTVPFPAELDPRTLSDALTLGPEGIYFAADAEPVSYLEEGNALCFQLEESSFWFAHRNACVCALARRFPPPGPIFDIGGGNGFVSRALQNAGFATVLVEPGPTGALNAKRRGVSPVICATLGSARFRPESMPAAALFDVLEHIENDAAFLDELARCLVPKGRLYLTVPAFQWLWSHDDVSAGHFRRYTLETLRARIEAAGFSISYASYFFVPLPPALWLLRALPSGFGRRPLAPQGYGRLHRPPVAGPLLETFFGWERRRIESAAPLPFGSSCLLVAEKL